MISPGHLPNISPMAAKRLFVLLLAGLLLALLVTGCAVNRTAAITRIALLAPFEGRYREVGYDLLYAARLALSEGGYTGIELLPIDDGGNTTNAVAHARALALNPTVQIVLVAGYPATDPAVQAAFADLPVLVIGQWGATPASDQVLMLAGSSEPVPRLDVLDAAALPAPVTGGEVFALQQFPQLRADLSGITISTSAALPDVAFTERYLASDQFVKPPGLLVTLAYDATHIAAQAVQSGSDRTQALAALKATTYSGINGAIQFENGYWLNAPVYHYRYNAAEQLELAN